MKKLKKIFKTKKEVIKMNFYHNEIEEMCKNCIHKDCLTCEVIK